MLEIVVVFILVAITLGLMFAIAHSIDMASKGSLDGFGRSTPKEYSPGGSTGGVKASN